MLNRISAASSFTDRSVVGFGSGEDTSRLDLELWNLICFFYRPDIVTRLVRQHPPLIFRVGRECTRLDKACQGD
jgi:hypothetical protein